MQIENFAKCHGKKPANHSIFHWKKNIIEFLDPNHDFLDHRVHIYYHTNQLLL